MKPTLPTGLFARALAIALDYRIITTRLMAALLGLLVLLTHHFWTESGLADILFEMTGLVFLTVGAFGRLWASMYIAGYKRAELITVGPYSVVRNPLYVFSFIGAVGVGLSAESFLIVLLIVAGFLFYYPLVVEKEEKKLAERHGKSFEDYARGTPRFIPNFSLLREPEVYAVKAKKYRRAFVDASFFILSYALLQLIEKLHGLGILPVLFRIP